MHKRWRILMEIAKVVLDRISRESPADQHRPQRRRRRKRKRNERRI